MSADHIVILAVLAVVAIVGAFLAANDHPWLAFFLVLVTVNSIKVSA